MSETYSVFKFLHVLGAMVWIGGLLAVSVLNARVARTSDREAMTAAGNQSEFFGARVLGPAVGITAIAGVVLIGVSGWIFPLWVVWGIVAMIFSAVLGATVIRRTGTQLLDAVRPSAPGDAATRIPTLQRHLAQLGAINMIVLLSVVWVMVEKP